MGSTSVHLPAEVVERLDRLAAERGQSRNRLIVAACEAWLAAQDGAWPDGFFDARVDQDDAEALRLGADELDAAIREARRERAGRTDPFS